MPSDTTIHRSRTGDPTANTLIDRLISAWDAGSPVALGDLLPTDPTASMVADVACQEIELKLRAGQPARVADYLLAYPEVAASNDLVVYLLEAEVLGRRKHGPPPTLDEYIREFPLLRAEVERLFGAVRPVLPQSPEGYELLEEIGRGGMGVIYRARDKALKREVAIKVLQDRYAPDSSVGQRFLEEAQITGQLQHPGIPAIHQVGKLADGRPFLAMKLIKGQTLAALIKAKSEINTLGVFESICQAVGYAHERSVIHRDLKPENVMVGAFGEVQVMDWGLAKFIGAKQPAVAGETQVVAPSTAIEDPRTPERLDQTGVAGTPWYMAPEQAAGEQEKIDARTDVFALGGILCAMLTGKPPIEGADQKAAQVNAVRGETTAAFARLDGIGVEQELIGLCKKCLGFAPDVRYTTAGELAKVIAKLRAEADDRAKQAELDKARADERALAERNRRRVLLVAGLTVSCVLLAGIGASLWQLSRANQAEVETAKQLAETKRAEADTAAQLVKTQQAEVTAVAEKKTAQAALRKAEDRGNELWNGLDAMTADIVGDSLGTQKAVSDEQKKFLGTVLPLYRQLAQETGDDEKARARLARAAFRVGLIEDRLGRKKEGTMAFQKAQEAFEKLAADFPAVPDYRQGLAQSHNSLGILLNSVGKQVEAEEHYRKGLAIHTKLAADFPIPFNYRSDLATSYDNLGILLKSLGKRLDAEDCYRQGLSIREKLTIDFPTLTDHRRALAQSYTSLGILLKDAGNKTEAENLYLKGLAIRVRLAGDFPTVPTYRNDLAESNSNLGHLLAGMGRRTEAEEHYRKGLAIRTKLAADFPAVPDYSQALARSHTSLGLLLNGVGKQIESEEHYRKGLAILTKLTADFPDLPDHWSDLASCHSNLGVLQHDMGKLADAEEQIKKSVVIREKLAEDFPAVPAYRYDRAASYNNLGRLLANSGKLQEAHEQHRKGLDLQKKLVDDFPTIPLYCRDLAGSYNNLGRLLASMGKRTEAEEQYLNALSIGEKLVTDFPAVPAYRSDLANTHNNFGSLLSGGGKRAEAEKQYRKGLAIQEKLATDFPTVPNYRRDLGGSYYNIGNLRLIGGQPLESIEFYDKAIKVLSPIYSSQAHDATTRQYLVVCYSNRATAYERLGKHGDAVKDWNAAIGFTDLQEQPQVRVRLVVSQVKSGAVAEAVTEAEQLTKSQKWNANHWYKFACVYSIASNEIRDKKDEYSNRAIEFLRNAIRAGWNDAAKVRMDKDLDPLRDREDFKKLLADLEKIAPPKEPATAPKEKK